MKFLNRPSLLLLIAVAAGCSTPTPHASQTVEPIHVTATMPSRYDVTLTWQDTSKTYAGHIVEFATEPNGQYTRLGFWPADENTFTHSRLIPDTTFYYRILPYIGPASVPAEVSLAANLTEAEYTNRYAAPEDYSWGAPETIPAKTAPVRKSIRDPHTTPAAAPTNLKAVIAPETVSGVHLTWTDHDTDAEGYLIEMKADDEPDYHVCAVVAPNINSFGWSLHPPQRKGTFRIRAYYVGHPSSLISEKTGPESEAAYMIPK